MEATFKLSLRFYTIVILLIIFRNISAQERIEYSTLLPVDPIGRSLPAHRNINHPDATFFQDIKKSVCKVFSYSPILNKFGWGSAFLVNTVNNSFAPEKKIYLMTVNHNSFPVGINFLESTTLQQRKQIYLSFDFEVSDPNLKRPNEIATSEALDIKRLWRVDLVPLVQDYDSDIALYEIIPYSDDPDNHFSADDSEIFEHVYATGWSLNINSFLEEYNPEGLFTLIGHPRGDIKKFMSAANKRFSYEIGERDPNQLLDPTKEYEHITRDKELLVSSHSQNFRSQSGSSGSPLFNPQKKVIGLLSADGSDDHLSTILKNRWLNIPIPTGQNPGYLQNFLDPDETWISSVSGGYLKDLIPNSSIDFDLTISSTTPFNKNVNLEALNFFKFRPIPNSVENVLGHGILLKESTVLSSGQKVYLSLHELPLNQVNPLPLSLLYGVYLDNLNTGTRTFKHAPWYSPAASGPVTDPTTGTNIPASSKIKKRLISSLKARGIDEDLINFLSDHEIYANLKLQTNTGIAQVRAIKLPNQMPYNARELFEPEAYTNLWQSYKYKESRGKETKDLHIKDIKVDYIYSPDVIEEGEVEISNISTGNNGGYLNLVNPNYKIGNVITNTPNTNHKLRITLNTDGDDSSGFYYGAWLDYFNTDALGGRKELVNNNPNDPDSYTYNFAADPAPTPHTREILEIHEAENGTIEIQVDIPESTEISLNEGEKRLTRLRVAVAKSPQNGIALTQDGIYEDGEVEDYLIELVASECEASKPFDYIAYAEEVLPYCGPANYRDQKTELAQSYQETSSGSLTFNVNEDIKDVPFATAWGKHYSFNGKKQNGLFTNGLRNLIIPRTNESKRLGDDVSFLRLDHLNMDIYYPVPKDEVSTANLKEIPVIIHLFGGGFVRNDDGEMGPNTAKWLASKGYLVASIDYRLGMTIYDGELAKRAMIRAWQDIRAAVQFWRYTDDDDATYNNIFDNGSQRWHIDTDKIYGVGHSAGGITLFHNIYLTENEYSYEKLSGGILEAAGGDYPFSVTPERVTTVINDMNNYYNNGFFEGLFSGNILDPNLIPPLISTINTLSSPTTYYTYDLDDFPSVPCIGVNAGCLKNLTQSEIKAQETIIKGYNLKPELDKGVAFSGAVLDNNWLIGNTTPVADIHHELDKIVSIDIDKPFTNYGDFINLYNIPFTSEIENIYGGRAMDDLLANDTELGFNFNLLELTGDNKAGGNAQSYHRSTQKFGSTDRNEIEPKLMYYVDAFFMKDWGTAMPKSAPKPGKGSNTSIVTEPIDQPDFSIYPNPASDKLNILVEVRQEGPLYIDIYDMNGRRVYNIKRDNISQGHQLITLPVKTLSSGNYILKIRAGDVRRSEKVIVE